MFLSMLSTLLSTQSKTRQWMLCQTHSTWSWSQVHKASHHKIPVKPHALFESCLTTSRRTTTLTDQTVVYQKEWTTMTSTLILTIAATNITIVWTQNVAPQTAKSWRINVTKSITLALVQHACLYTWMRSNFIPARLRLHIWLAVLEIEHAIQWLAITERFAFAK